MGQARPGNSGEVALVDGSDRPALSEPARLAALEQTGLGPGADPALDFLAAWARRAIGVPAAVVSLVQSERQVFSGMAGLPEPWASTRSAPLRYSFCRRHHHRKALGDHRRPAAPTRPGQPRDP
jgi:hypothetical protein